MAFCWLVCRCHAARGDVSLQTAVTPDPSGMCYSVSWGDRTSYIITHVFILSASCNSLSSTIHICVSTRTILSLSPSLAHTHTQSHTHIHTQTHTHTRTHSHTHIHKHTLNHILTYIHTHTHSHSHSLTYAHTQTHIHSHTFIHTYICIYIYTKCKGIMLKYG